MRRPKKNHSKPRVSACSPCSFPVCCCFFFAFAFLPSAFSFRLFCYCFLVSTRLLFRFSCFLLSFSVIPLFCCFFLLFLVLLLSSFLGLLALLALFCLFVFCSAFCLFFILFVTDCFLSLKGNLQVSRRNPSLVMITLYGLYVLSYSYLNIEPFSWKLSHSTSRVTTHELNHTCYGRLNGLMSLAASLMLRGSARLMPLKNETIPQNRNLPPKNAINQFP